MTLANAVIKGYHVYKIKPLVTSVKLIVDREYINIQDENAFLVWLPELDHFPKSMISEYADIKRHCYCRDIAGLPAGHVSRCLAGFL